MFSFHKLKLKDLCCQTTFAKLVPVNNTEKKLKLEIMMQFDFPAERKITVTELASDIFIITTSNRTNGVK